MGTYIHTFAERRKIDGSWEEIEGVDFFSQQNYSMFGFLADVRNYSMTPTIALPRGLPDDVSCSIACEHESYGLYAHTASWLSLKELLEFNYDATFENRRVIVNASGAHTCKPGMGEITTYRESFCEQFQTDLLLLRAIGAERIVFWFSD